MEHEDDAHEDDAHTEDPQLDAAADKLARTYAEDGPLTQEDVTDAVYDAAEELDDAPLKTFVPLLAENKARSELHTRARDAEREQ